MSYIAVCEECQRRTPAPRLSLTGEKTLCQECYDKEVELLKNAIDSLVKKETRKDKE